MLPSGNDENGGSPESDIGLVAQIQSELSQILAVLGNLTGLSSRWSGTVELIDEPGVKGRKPFRCDILISRSLASQPIRWSTLIHEALHSLSAGYLRDDYQAFQGWEEGVVEKLQRIFRSRVLQTVGAGIDEDIFATIDKGHAYNGFIGAIEDMRHALETNDAPVPVEVFYANLLRTPIRDRPGYVYSLGNKLGQEQYSRFLLTFSMTGSRLRTKRTGT